MAGEDEASIVAGHDPFDEVGMRYGADENEHCIGGTLLLLAPPAADALHPAFGNLFVQTEIHRERHAILCTRRPRSAGEQAPWMFHLLVVHGATVGEACYETDRARFVGRGNTAADPRALIGHMELSGSEGSVLDPIVAIRRCINLEPDGSAAVNVVSGMSETR